MKEVTVAQRRLLLALWLLTEENGLPPTVRELALREGWCHSYIAAAFHQMARKGLVTQAYNTARSLRLTEKGRAEVTVHGYQWVPLLNKKTPEAPCPPGATIVLDLPSVYSGEGDETGKDAA